MTPAPERVFMCDDCGWRWPLKDRGQVIDYCDACTGTMRPASTASLASTKTKRKD
jgi:hypothetical protein